MLAVADARLDGILGLFGILCEPPFLAARPPGLLPELLESSRFARFIFLTLFWFLDLGFLFLRLLLALLVVSLPVSIRIL